ncbi:hypothetical protein EVAR_94205_1 [Eumeta japonica]|uniref:Uncharacterized protein n=1 Tax=Eumeta variegata TaxID=151549 RepID=A0A4C1UMY6_EUMVA|nr:hypothetical protein EVAR_94205_1 [Eumeta japonica]
MIFDIQNFGNLPSSATSYAETIVEDFPCVCPRLRVTSVCMVRIRRLEYTNTLGHVRGRCINASYVPSQRPVEWPLGAKLSSYGTRALGLGDWTVVFEVQCTKLYRCEVSHESVAVAYNWHAEEKKEGPGALNLRIISFLGNPERQTFVLCTVISGTLRYSGDALRVRKYRPIRQALRHFSFV